MTHRASEGDQSRGIPAPVSGQAGFDRETPFRRETP